ncbi:hypothetical protein DPX16_23747 [Anabarilius grahami]|uniref:Uncharacterized protein n=1 Tax=Anabarilius grahami TaxID=495550 RepID=A0A3N0YGE6_ANAGA|nr:hypothetical protein DPX16_23747 [Anabarilius grahami]
MNSIGSVILSCQQSCQRSANSNKESTRAQPGRRHTRWGDKVDSMHIGMQGMSLAASECEEWANSSDDSAPLLPKEPDDAQPPALSIRLTVSKKRATRSSPEWKKLSLLISEALLDSPVSPSGLLRLHGVLHHDPEFIASHVSLPAKKSQFLFFLQSLQDGPADSAVTQASISIRHAPVESGA